MNQSKLKEVVERAFEIISSEIPKFRNSEVDWSISDGNVAACIIDETGMIYGKIWGDDKVRGRSFYDIAYRKASQVWITGMKTGEYEKAVFAGEINYKDFGIELPDLMGWEGGQPIDLDNETRISCGFSGFEGVNDLSIVKNAIKKALAELI
ncbi:GlcG/HbpS family heme-binding protein [Jiulongibacter sediminis]|uniref:Heme-binding protein n=1 Tax=Jiulongibacter sediminis TaxID=1605367 RepID=A0A0P7C9L4_9BACT|nr:heme-binding protein [Jiulongibacter sediminis]KPM49199.1 hypothetical protein AFM12_00705 [Jiulongibacter sediminis]TBX26254.1 hypothetical protein TK44_00705 [Jiulongibacter sediminis]